VQGWVNQVKRLRDLRPSLELFYGRIDPLVRSTKLGPVLWQRRRRSGATTNG